MRKIVDVGILYDGNIDLNTLNSEANKFANVDTLRSNISEASSFFTKFVPNETKNYNKRIFKLLNWYFYYFLEDQKMRDFSNVKPIDFVSIPPGQTPFDSAAMPDATKNLTKQRLFQRLLVKKKEVPNQNPSKLDNLKED